MGTDHNVPSGDARLRRVLQARRNFDEAASRLAEQGRIEVAEGISEIEMLEQATGMTDPPDPECFGPKP